METSLLMARIIGPYCVIVALGVLINLKYYRQMIEDLLLNRAVIYISGVLALLFSLLVIQFHNVWTLEWPVIITLTGWLGLIKGVRLIVFPAYLPGAVAFYQKNRTFLIARLLLVLFLGIFLTLEGCRGIY